MNEVELLCGDVIPNEDINEYDITKCEVAGCENVDYSDYMEVIRDTLVCENCVHEGARLCRSCDELEFTSELIQGVCQPCYDNYYETCQSCGDIGDRDYMYYSERYDEFYCDNNYCKPEGLIQAWDYKPYTEFFGTSVKERYFGVELEIDNGDNNEITAENMEHEAIYFKEDGSLNNGFEIVTHPCTLEYHMKELNWERLAEIAIDNGYTSHDAGTCGLHVHISREAFGKYRDVQDDNIEKLLMLIEKHWDKFRIFARRTEGQLQEWARSYLQEQNEYRRPNREHFCTKELLEQAKESGRYYAVNLRNRKTVELRLFRGTLKVNTIKATIQMCNMLVELTLHNSLEKLMKASWDRIVNAIYYKDCKELNQYLVERELI